MLRKKSNKFLLTASFREPITGITFQTFKVREVYSGIFVYFCFNIAILILILVVVLAYYKFENLNTDISDIYARQ